MEARFIKKEQMTADFTTFWFQSERPVRYQAGQFVELTLPHAADERGERRWFTLSSSPTEELLSITTRLVPKKSSYKTQLTDLQPGDKVHVSQPMGDFVLPRDAHRPLLFAAAGIGITPVRSMLTFLSDTHEQRDIQLLFMTRGTDIPFRSLLQRMTAFQHFDSTKKRLAATDVLAAAEDMADPIIFISGPEAFAEKLQKALTPHIDQTRLVTDYFHGYN